MYTAAVAPTLPLDVTRPCKGQSWNELVHTPPIACSEAVDLNVSLLTNNRKSRPRPGLFCRPLALLPSKVCESFPRGTAVLHELNVRQASSCRPSCLPSCLWHPSLSLKGPLLLCLTWLLMLCKSSWTVKAQEQLLKQCSVTSKQVCLKWPFARTQNAPCFRFALSLV